MKKTSINLNLMRQHRVEARFLSRLTNRTLDGVFPGRYVGHFFSTSKYLIACKPTTYKMENNSRCAQFRAERRRISEEVKLVTAMAPSQRPAELSTTNLPVLAGWNGSPQLTQAQYLDQVIAMYRSAVITIPAFTVIDCAADKIPCFDCPNLPFFGNFETCNSCQYCQAIAGIVSPSLMLMPSLLDIYMIERVISIDRAVNELENKLKIHNDGLFADVKSLESGGWHRKGGGRAFCLGPCLHFYDDVGNVIGTVEKKTEGYVPWSTFRYRDSDFDHVFALPFERPYPLFNLNGIAQNPDLPVVLYTEFHYVFEYQGVPPTFAGCVPATWFIGWEVANEVDIFPIRGRQVVLAVGQPGQAEVDDSEMKAVNRMVSRLEPLVAEMLIAFACDGGFGEPENPKQFRERFGFAARSDVEDAALCTDAKPGTLSSRDFVRSSRPSQWLLTPLVMQPTCLHVYSGPGGLKTMLCLTMSAAIATGEEVLPFFKCPVPGQVLYVDGERRPELPSKWQAVCRGIGVDYESDIPIRFLSKTINVLNDDGRAEIDQYLAEMENQGQPVRLLALDNLTHMGGHSSAEDAWTAFSAWLKSLNTRGISVIYVGHQGSQGEERFSRRQSIDALCSIRIEPVDGSDSSSGSGEAPRREVDLTFAKIGDNPWLNDGEKIRLVFDKSPCERGFVVNWSSTDFDSLIVRVMAHQCQLGMTDEEMAKAWGISSRQILTFRNKHKLVKYNKKKH